MILNTRELRETELETLRNVAFHLDKAHGFVKDATSIGWWEAGSAIEKAQSAVETALEVLRTQMEQEGDFEPLLIMDLLDTKGIKIEQRPWGGRGGAQLIETAYVCRCLNFQHRGYPPSKIRDVCPAAALVENVLMRTRYKGQVAAQFRELRHMYLLGKGVET